MTAVLSRMPPEPDLFGFEYKWDGVRVLAFCEGGRARLQSRNEIDVTSRYPELAGLGAACGRRAMVFDGEMVALDREQRPSFSLLQKRMHVARPASRLIEQVPVVYMIFDLLYENGRPIMDLPYVQRRRRLEKLDLGDAGWQVPGYVRGAGDKLLALARRSGLEGIMAKRLTSKYQPGARSDAWRKIKIAQRQEFVIGGWTPGEGRLKGRIGSLLLGYLGRHVLHTGRKPPKHPELHYAGLVGTGLDEADHRQLLPMLTALRRSTSPFAEPVPRRDARFVEPELVAEVEFREWTHEGILRHPAFKGLRTDKPAAAVVLECVER